MKRFGVINPLIVDSRNRIVAGHARAEAARSLNLKIVPVVRVADLSDVELRAYMLADNRLAESAGWDRELLALEFLLCCQQRTFSGGWLATAASVCFSAG